MEVENKLALYLNVSFNLIHLFSFPNASDLHRKWLISMTNFNEYMIGKSQIDVMKMERIILCKYYVCCLYIVCDFIRFKCKKDLMNMSLRKYTLRQNGTSKV